MKKIATITLILLLVFTTTVFAKEESPTTIIKEFEFTSTDESKNFKFESAPPQIIEDGITYFSQGKIEYVIIEENPITEKETKTFTEEVIVKGLEQPFETVNEAILNEVFEKTLEIHSDGFQGKLKLKDITYEQAKAEGRTASDTADYNYCYQLKKPNPPRSIKYLYEDEETGVNVLATLYYDKLLKGKTAWVKTFYADEKYTSTSNAEYKLLDNTVLSFTSNKPVYTGHEKQILKQMRLDDTSHRIIGSSWVNELKSSDGKYTRVARYEIERYSTQYTARYSGEFEIPNMLVYDAIGIYENKLTKEVSKGTEYKVKAKVTYVAEEKPVNIGTIVGTSGGIIGVCGLVFFLMKRRKQKNPSNNAL